MGNLKGRHGQGTVNDRRGGTIIKQEWGRGGR